PASSSGLRVLTLSTIRPSRARGLPIVTVALRRPRPDRAAALGASVRLPHSAASPSLAGVGHEQGEAAAHPCGQGPGEVLPLEGAGGAPASRSHPAKAPLDRRDHPPDRSRA